ncbi:ATP-binding cassette, subfamily B [Ruminococcus sp. YE71]|uniref:ABC transporter ATP-binding protein n=1 Tax=unclassified Ruminococcus TaxID=2608920 RepID=UPI000890472A|nr:MULTISPECIES: ABC transporter ATP-binding protein [unclassified Ruminococcus]SDA10273.1 ATP-binding cassette, subfamily B [Ruminococcus sp. YE78]SFW10880.1 ATP-binding cassette, subfamily B [Ruminococcus sp. YE71]
MPRQPYVKDPNAPKPQMGRILGDLFKNYKGRMVLVIVCLIFTSLAGTAASVFIKNIVSVIEKSLELIKDGSTYEEALKACMHDLAPVFAAMIAIYVLGIAASLTQQLNMAVITQGHLAKMREKMFRHMERLPIRYFDQHPHGDIMSHYTNDIDTLRQLISQALPQAITAGLTLVVLFIVMLYYSLWMTLLVCVGVCVMFMVTKKVGGNSAKYFIRQQKALGKTEGYIEEMIEGQKVVKVFCHEDKSKAEFDAINGDLFKDANEANKYANILMPIMGNIGNIMYILMSFVGGVLITLKVPNVSLSGGALDIAVVVTFLGMTRQFCNNISQVSQQINAVAMAMAGATRIYSLLDEKPEADDGYVTLVNAKFGASGELEECEERTGIWAWKHPHQDGTTTLTKVEGKVELNEVDFGYVPEKIVLHEVSIYANPGEKIAFVGATGAGKTTITNLINRFYDIADGKIRYDGININKIKKDDLRRSLGIVLQDVNLFTGTVMDNIRYGNLEATDEECIAAARLANAHDFITRLPEGYNTMLTGNGANLSQGQRQLISIARAAVADPPVMILDEATSSIDTRTEALVQRGMDGLMYGRTVFVIAHRLSTVQNSDVIMVLEQGSIIERGSHKKLIEEKGKYYQLYTGAFELE